VRPVRRRVHAMAMLGSVLLGLGLGGFFDGIVLHQILQWHHLISEAAPADTVAGLRVNVLADGIFHLGTYAFTLAGLAFLWMGLSREHRPMPATLLVGGLLLGWGLFNLVEGVVNHHLLQLHHVRPGPNQLWWDLGFLAWGAVMAVVGAVLMRRGRRVDPNRLTRAGEPV
jgi:uncharacterized membrane protein